MSDKKIALRWSKKIYTNIEKNIDLPRVFLNYIPKNIDEYKTSTKKKVVYKYFVTNYNFR